MQRNSDTDQPELKRKHFFQCKQTIIGHKHIKIKRSYNSEPFTVLVKLRFSEGKYKTRYFNMQHFYWNFFGNFLIMALQLVC